MARSPPRKSVRSSSRPAANAAKAATGRKPAARSGRSAPTTTARGKATTARTTTARTTTAAKPTAARTRTSASTNGATRATATLMPAPRTGMVTHTEFASSDPGATRSFLEKAFGWSFSDFPQPDGSSYAMWRGPNDTGGGIRGLQPGMSPGTVPYVEARTVAEALTRIQAAGGEVVLPRTEIGNDMGAIALCRAPGGVTVGIWAPR